MPTPAEVKARRKHRRQAEQARQVVSRGIDRAHVGGQLKARDEARAAKDFAASDRIRAELKALEVEVLDSPSGTSWKILPLS
jgi:cysteinyl-tRNA synthetase